MAAPLNNEQKRYLSQLARQAWEKAGPDLDGMSAEDYRRQEVAKACGKLGLRCCSQDDYGAVKGHFLNLLGASGAAFKAIHHGAGNARRVAEYKVVQACEAAGVDLSYADRICRNVFKCSLQDANESQLWKVMFTVKNRGRKVTFPKEPIAA